MSATQKLLGILLLGLLLRGYGITQHWRTNDHYNFGGPWMQSLVFCLKRTPLSESHGVPHHGCSQEQNLADSPVFETLSDELKLQVRNNHLSPVSTELVYYRNHPPLPFYVLWGLTDLFGEKEWVFRLYTLIFSVLNIYLVYRIACIAWKDETRALLAAFFQTIFLETIYFGTHVDVLTEFTTTFLLLSALSALKNRALLAIGFAIVAGLTDWMGFLMFVPLLAHAKLTKRSIAPYVIGGFLSVGVGYAVASWMLGTWNLIGFIQDRILHPPYAQEQTQGFKIWLLPYYYSKTFVTSHSRMLSPLLASFAFYELGWGKARHAISQQFQSTGKYGEALLLTGGTGLVTAIIGYKYVMVHIFWFILWVPVFALLCAEFCASFLDGSYKVSWKVLRILTSVFVLFYPYGIYNTYLAHDIFNSLGFVLTAGLFAWKAPNLSPKSILTFVLLCGFFNFSQVVNYRGESDTEYSFCADALKSYLTNGPVVTTERPSLTKTRLYCRGIPITYR